MILSENRYPLFGIMLSEGKTMPAILAALASGLIFGCGLAISGMTQPAKVLGFLDVLGIASGTWDPTLAFVMIGALAVAAPGYALARRRAKPVLAPASLWPTKTDLDRPLIARRRAVRPRLGSRRSVSRPGHRQPRDALAARGRLRRRHGDRHAGAG
jgi:Family of unknown function (DUF6691)